MMNQDQKAGSKEEQWRRLFVEWEASGKPQREFCGDKGLPFSSFRYWRHRLYGNKRKTPTDLVRVPNEVSQSAGERSVVRIHVGDFVIEVDAGVLTEQLKAILTAVREVL